MQSCFDMVIALSSDGARWLFQWSWQSLLLLASVCLIARLYRFKSAALRHHIWLLGLIAVAILPFWLFVAQFLTLSRPANEAISYVVDVPNALTELAASSSQAFDSTDSGRTVARSRFVWSSFIWSLLFAIWAAGFVVAIARLCRSYLQLHRAQTRGRSVSVAELKCGDVDWGRLDPSSIEIKLAGEITSPLLTGLIRPVILLPADIMNWTSIEERVSIIRHELVHAERRDCYATYFQALIGAIMFFHPLIRYACHQICMERELACDESVLRMGTAASAYAESILKVAERSTLQDALHQPAAFASKKSLERRINMILDKPRLPLSSRRWHLLTLAIALIAVTAWIITPGRRVAAGQLQDQVGGHSERAASIGDGKDARVMKMLFKSLGDAKDFDKLIDIALTDSDAGLRHQAVERLTQLEGDGSTAALIELYNRSRDSSVKKKLIESLGERNEYEILTEIVSSELDLELRNKVFEQIERIEKTSDSKDRC